MRELARKRFVVPLWAPRVAGWWLLVLGCGAGAWLAADALVPGIRAYPVAAVMATVLTIPLVVAWWWALRIPQLWQRVARSGAIAAIAWGAFAAAGLYALPANGALLTVVGQSQGFAFAQDWGAALVAPLTEETGKVLAVGVVLVAARERLRTPTDGALLGAFAGVGFTAIEDFLYAFNVTHLNLGENEAVSTLVIYLARAVIFGAASHVVFSAAVGLGLGFLIAGRGASRWARGAGWIAAGVGLHWLWNSPLAAPIWVRLVYLVAVPGIVWLMLHDARSADHRWFRDVLATPGAIGDVSPAYVDTVKRSWLLRRRHREAVRRAYGDAAVIAQREVEAALTDLADAVDMGDEADATRARTYLAARLG